MFKLVSIGLLFLNSFAASNAQFFVCEVQTLGFTQAVSNALGNGTNSDGFLEGSLVLDLHLNRETAETIVNMVHSELFPSVTEHIYTDCE